MVVNFGGMFPMSSLVTGGAGFIGSNMVGELVRRGHVVTVFDDFSADKEANLERIRQQKTFIRGSIAVRGTIEKACRGADYVLHLAARHLGNAHWCLIGRTHPNLYVRNVTSLSNASF